MQAVAYERLFMQLGLQMDACKRQKGPYKALFYERVRVQVRSLFSSPLKQCTCQKAKTDSKHWHPGGTFVQVPHACCSTLQTCRRLHNRNYL